MNEKAISKALLTQLKTVVGLPQLVVDNGTPYSPSPTVSYCREYDLSGDTFNPSLAGYQRKDGVYQVDVFTPKGKGKWEGLDVVGLIQSVFTAGLIISDSGQRVQIKTVSRSSPRENDTHYAISVSIGYIAI